MDYTVLLEDGTVGVINDESLDGMHPEDFCGDVVRVHLHDENGNPIEREGRLVEVLS